MDYEKAKRMLSEFNVIEHIKRRLVNPGYVLFEKPIEERCSSLMNDLKLVDSKILKIEIHKSNEVLVRSIFPDFKMSKDKEIELSFVDIRNFIWEYLKQNYTFPIVEIESIETKKEEDVVLNSYKFTSKVVLNFYETDLIDFDEIEGVIEIQEINEEMEESEVEIFAYSVCADRYELWKEQGGGIPLNLWYVLNYGN